VLFLKEQEVRELLPMRQAVELMRTLFADLRAGTAQNQPRRRMYMPTASVLHSMAGACGKYYGTKIYSTNARAGNAEFLFWLLDAATSKPLALMQANWLGQIRTGAASGYATDLLASKSADRMGVIGAGFQARAQVEAVSEVRDLKEVRVWSRQESNRQRFAAEIHESLGIASVVAAASAEDAVSGMPIVTTATWSKDPVLESKWIAEGAVVNAMGSNNPERRELPADLIDRAGRIVVDSIEVARIESGDLMLAWKAEDWSTPRLMELKDLTSAPRPAEEVAIFKSNGLGVEDVAVGGWVYEQALCNGVGRQI
jgi:ornithine cyclodeaminase/alanine dehydrogenase-like protein (mu-crystallin family)